MGRKAGPLRNKQMAEYADGVVLFWDQKSRGTRSMLGFAKEFARPYMVFSYSGELLEVSKGVEHQPNLL